MTKSEFKIQIFNEMLKFLRPLKTGLNEADLAFKIGDIVMDQINQHGLKGPHHNDIAIYLSEGSLDSNGWEKENE